MRTMAMEPACGGRADTVAVDGGPVPGVAQHRIRLPGCIRRGRLNYPGGSVSGGRGEMLWPAGCSMLKDFGTSSEAVVKAKSVDAGQSGALKLAATGEGMTTFTRRRL